MSRMEIHPIFKFVNSEWFIPISSGKGRKKKFVEYSDQIKKFLPNSRDSFIPGFDPCCLLPVLALLYHPCGSKGNGRTVGLDDLIGPFQPWDSMILHIWAMDASDLAAHSSYFPTVIFCITMAVTKSHSKLISGLFFLVSLWYQQFSSSYIIRPSVPRADKLKHFHTLSAFLGEVGAI